MPWLGWVAVNEAVALKEATLESIRTNRSSGTMARKATLPPVVETLMMRVPSAEVPPWPSATTNFTLSAVVLRMSLREYLRLPEVRSASVKVNPPPRRTPERVR